jgi:hypothetical protein
MIGVHNLECQGGLRASRYGDGRKEQVDMLHMRGTSGKVVYNRNVASILAGAGLTTLHEAQQVVRCKRINIRRPGGKGFKTQGRRGRAGPGSSNSAPRSSWLPRTGSLGSRETGRPPLLLRRGGSGGRGEEERMKRTKSGMKVRSATYFREMLRTR